MGRSGGKGLWTGKEIEKELRLGELLGIGHVKRGEVERSAGVSRGGK